MTATVDSTGWNQRRRRVDRTLRLAGRRIALEVATQVGRYVLAVAPVDTGRYVRAVAQAVNSAGGGPLPMRTISPSGRHDQVVRKLSDQAIKWEKYASWLRSRQSFLYPSGPPKRGRTAAYGRFTRAIEQADRLAARAKEELAKAVHNDSALLVGFLHSGRTQKGRSLLTVRTPIYGGTGRLVEASTGQAAVELKVLEPHARFLEKKLHLFARARVSRAVAYGVTTLTTKELDRVATA